jgi:hypothetical protein
LEFLNTRRRLEANLHNTALVCQRFEIRWQYDLAGGGNVLDCTYALSFTRLRAANQQPAEKITSALPWTVSSPDECVDESHVPPPHAFQKTPATDVAAHSRVYSELRAQSGSGPFSALIPRAWEFP